MSSSIFSTSFRSELRFSSFAAIVQQQRNRIFIATIRSQSFATFSLSLKEKRSYRSDRELQLFIFASRLLISRLSERKCQTTGRSRHGGTVRSSLTLKQADISTSHEFRVHVPFIFFDPLFSVHDNHEDGTNNSQTTRNEHLLAVDMKHYYS